MTYRVTLVCNGVPIQSGDAGASDITEEFKNRPWHKNVHCTWDGTTLILRADSDWDEDGKALMDEFSDSISAYIAEAFSGDITIRSIVIIP
jgi:hypothetical protein